VETNAIITLPRERRKESVREARPGRAGSRLGHTITNSAHAGVEERRETKRGSTRGEKRVTKSRTNKKKGQQRGARRSHRAKERNEHVLKTSWEGITERRTAKPLRAKAGDRSEGKRGRSVRLNQKRRRRQVKQLSETSLGGNTLQRTGRAP